MRELLICQLAIALVMRYDLLFIVGLQILYIWNLKFVH